jgi:hypothetical protein
MLSSLRRSALLATLAILGAGSMPAVMAQPAMTSAAPRPVGAGKRVASGGRRSLGLYGRKSAGITAAQQKRASAKKRGIARNRRHHR